MSAPMLIKKYKIRLSRNRQMLGTRMTARLCGRCPLLPDIVTGFWGNTTNIVFVPAVMRSCDTMSQAKAKSACLPQRGRWHEVPEGLVWRKNRVIA